MKHIDTVVIGGGQAGLVMSHYLQEAGREHVVLEKERMVKSWREERWDSFTLVTPNWQLKLPGMAYEGDDPDGFLRREEVVDYLERFIERVDPPVREGVEATAVELAPDADALIVRTSDGDYQAENVVVAAGTFQRANIPDFSSQLNSEVEQMHSSEYRNPEQLAPGAVLVVGSGQSGCQIAEELLEDGRKVYLATGRAQRLPRRYRGKDSMRWLVRTGFVDRTVDKLPSPEARFAPNPHVSGKDGGRTINLHRFCREGMRLLGHVRDGRGTKLAFAPDLKENLAAADEFAKEFKEGVDEFIEKQGLQAPEEDEAELRDGYEAPVITELDLEEAGIKTIIWATGYEFDFSWIDFPIFDEYGYPVQERGVTPQPGLYFLGLHWMHTIKSGLFLGIDEEAAYVAERMEEDG